MPEMDGSKLRAIRERKVDWSARPDHAMTARAHRRSERCISAGMDAYISKPIRTSEMFAMIESMLVNKTPIPKHKQADILDPIVN
jgi:CheY-like chemotaxis protein